MNCSLLEDDEYVNSVTQMLPSRAAEGRKELSDSRSVWDWIKYNVRAHAINYSKKKATERNEKEKNLQDEFEGCPIHPICNGSSKGLTVRHGSFNPSTQNDDPSTGSHFARDLEKIQYNVMREGRNAVGSTGSSRSVSDGDDPSTGSYFARDLEIIHYIAMREGRNIVGPIGSSRSVSDGDDPSTGSHFARDLEIIYYRVMREG